MRGGGVLLDSKAAAVSYLIQLLVKQSFPMLRSDLRLLFICICLLMILLTCKYKY